MAETFVVALESEPPERSSLRNPGEVRRAVFESIEKWHPPSRRTRGCQYFPRDRIVATQSP